MSAQAILYEGSEEAQEALNAIQTYKSPIDPSIKVILLFKAVGNAPVMKQTKYKIKAGRTFGHVLHLLRGLLNFKPEDTLVTYINQSFSPTPDDVVSNLFKMFATEGYLIVNYSTTPAWG
ncbi:ubiquitin-like autophagy protein Apg12-domain-containing protein [Crucibulum laeve]|uniref:Ubiquitin-like protein ATG12 n=1 Tax=Crucibulum laeve TaxID=68775 RepID=A0A5C3LQT9_9AGAR|nr:ubiquitin-like autophagy protein Apg12-domain-containing protein [Crucibulum laeve]